MRIGTITPELEYLRTVSRQIHSISHISLTEYFLSGSTLGRLRLIDKEIIFVKHYHVGGEYFFSGTLFYYTLGVFGYAAAHITPTVNHRPCNVAFLGNPLDEPCPFFSRQCIKICRKVCRFPMLDIVILHIYIQICLFQKLIISLPR